MRNLIFTVAILLTLAFIGVLGSEDAPATAGASTEFSWFASQPRSLILPNPLPLPAQK